MIAVTDEGELARNLALYLDDEVSIIDTPKRVIELKPRVVIHTLEAKDNKSTMWNNNVWFAINVARNANKLGALNVYISSYLIFDGKNGYYSESSTPSPINYFGMTKLAGETGIASLGNYLIVRAGAIYSMTYDGIIRPFIRSLLKRHKANCNDDFFLSPISVKEFSEIISKLIKLDARGIVNVGGKRISFTDLCYKLSEILGGSVVPVKGKYYDFSIDTWLLENLGISIRDRQEPLLF
ncbi:dTDP-4-dehydrorhamnose reductase [Candidatus Acidianus copahuensis]|uniref:dTDP-4-dehydrorhamnose reductase n=1 Tax=Candidatus Acidianus copahuensis TaxID=1160895 RepID=A0A031LS21_9CREN|nr:sugar nucleotide-binding protein [Candidatus Acidianus copahuensis]EZQ10586.1 dTDP-4-dehydrorhamnose reductase [Candidatus Acidianus copahuensis]